MIATWLSARDRALSASAEGDDSGAASGFRDMAAIEAAAAAGSCCSPRERLRLAILAAEADAGGEELGPAWDIVRGVMRDLSD